MISHEQFAEQSFFTDHDHMTGFSRIRSNLIYGKSRPVKISVVIPTYKRAHLLEEAIMSCLDQSFADFDIVIADNNPERNDDTELLIKRLASPRIIYYKNEENVGPLANFNRCIELSDSEYCVFLCSDDLLEHDYIRKVSEWIGTKDDIDMLLPQKDIQYPKKTYKMKGYSTFLRAFARVSRKDAYMRVRPVDFILYYPAAGPSGIVYKKSSFVDVGGFNPQWHPTGDYITHFLMALKKNTFLSSIDSGKYRMQENISLEKGIRGVYIIQNYLIRKAFSSTFPGYSWAGPFFKGAVYKWTKMNMPGKAENMYDVTEIKKHVKNCSFINFMFFIFIWCVSLLLLPYRIRKRK